MTELDNRMRFIYVLIDPRTREIRYVGQTCKSLNQRLAGHICDARDTNRSYRVCRWIRQVLAAGYRPIIEEVESGFWDDSYTNLRETAWIAAVKEFGSDLTNMLDGGGVYRGNSTITEETREKHRRAALRNNTDPMIKKKIEDGVSRFWKENPEAREISSARAKKMWSDPEFKTRAVFKTEEYRKKKSEIAKKTVALLRRECLECGLVANPGSIGGHQKGTGHIGIQDLPRAVFVK